MKRKLRHLGLDVHAETIWAAIAEPDGSVRELGMMRNRPEAVRKLLAKLGAGDSLRVCYEAGPTGYTLYWQLTALGVHCDVIAPSLIPTKAGDRVKTDRKDAVRLARAYRAGDLTAVWVPDAATEALRDLVRAREVTKQDQLRARHRVTKFLLRHGRQRPEGMKAWTLKHAQWLTQQHFALATTSNANRLFVEGAPMTHKLFLAVGAILPLLAAPPVRAQSDSLNIAAAVAHWLSPQLSDAHRRAFIYGDVSSPRVPPSLVRAEDARRVASILGDQAIRGDSAQFCPGASCPQFDAVISIHVVSIDGNTSTVVLTIARPSGSARVPVSRSGMLVLFSRSGVTWAYQRTLSQAAS